MDCLILVILHHNVLFVCLPQLEDTVSDDERYGDEDDPGIGICIGLSGLHLEVCMRSQCFNHV